MFEFIFTYPIFFVYTMIQLYRSDIIYWIQEPPFPKMFWLKYTKLLNKKNLVEYIGGDIRCPQILMKINLIACKSKKLNISINFNFN